MFRFLTFTALIACSLAGILSNFKPEGHIIGGHEVAIESHPHQVSFQVNSKHRCGASIISDKVAITAAHCLLYVFNMKALSVVAGTSKLNRVGVRIAVENFVMHENYEPFQNDNDIAILYLAKELKFSGSIQPIALAKALPADGAGVSVTGWGVTEEGGRVPNELQGTDLQIVGHEECQQKYSDLTSKMVCAGVTDGSRDSCQGDSGGPLVHKDQLVGVVSYGVGCGRPGYPGVYTSIPAYKRWIERKVKVKV